MAELSTANSISNEDWLERIRRLPLQLMSPGRQLCSPTDKGCPPSPAVYKEIGVRSFAESLEAVA
jgi:hypothetical protein